MRGSITKRGTKTYLIRLSLGQDPVTNKRTRHQETFHGSKREAEGRLNDLIQAHEQGRFILPNKLSLNAYLERWFAEAAQHKVTPVTLRGYQDAVRLYVRETVGRLPLVRVTPLHLQELYNSMVGRGLGVRTVQILHTVLRSSLKRAVLWRLIASNPALDVELPTAKKKKVIRAMDQEQAVAFLTAAETDRYAVLWSLLLGTGLRPGEALGLCWDCVDLVGGAVRVERALIRPKGGGWYLESPKTAAGRRVVELHNELVAQLRQHRSQQNQERLFMGSKWEQQPNGGFVFTNLSGGPLSENRLIKFHFKPALERADLPNSFRVYDLRHTAATLMLLAGVNPKVVSEMLGHSGINLTLDTYSHVLPTMQREAAGKLGAMLSGSKSSSRLRAL